MSPRHPVSGLWQALRPANNPAEQLQPVKIVHESISTVEPQNRSVKSDEDRQECVGGMKRFEAASLDESTDQAAV
jgi:hypothetical protein